MKLVFKYEIDLKDPIQFPDVISWGDKMNAVFPRDFNEDEQKEVLKDYLIDELDNLIHNAHNCKDCAKLDIDQFVSFKPSDKTQWKSWILDKEEIEMIMNKLGFDKTKFNEKDFNEIAENFKNWLSNSENDFWEDWIENSIKEFVENNKNRDFRDYRKIWLDIAQKNTWIKQRGSGNCNDDCAFEDPLNKDDFAECKTIEELYNELIKGNWILGQPFYYKNLCFINQINAGDEWLVIRDNIEFESLTSSALTLEEFKGWINRVMIASVDQLKSLEY